MMKQKVTVMVQVEMEIDLLEYNPDFNDMEFMTNTLKIHVENLLENDNEKEILVEALSDNINLKIEGLGFKVD